MIHRLVRALSAALVMSLCLGVSTAQAGEAAAPKPKKVFVIINITIKPDKYEETLKIIRDFAAYEAQHGVELVASYYIAIGQGNRLVNIWSADSLNAWQATVDGYMEVVNLEESYAAIVREDIEIAYENPIVQPKVVRSP